MGATAMLSPAKAAADFGIPVAPSEAIKLMPVTGIRNVGFGSAMLTLLAAGKLGYVNNGLAAAAILTFFGSCVGFGDAWCVHQANGRGAFGHAVGAAYMGISGMGLWLYR
jgi:hypothetical protein